MYIYIYVCVCVCMYIKPFVTLCAAAHKVSLFMGFSRQEYCNALPFPTPGDLPDSEIEFTSLRSPALAGRFFSTSSTWEAYTDAHAHAHTHTHTYTHTYYVSIHTHTLLVLFLQKTLINTSSLILLESGTNIM